MHLPLLLVAAGCRLLLLVAAAAYNYSKQIKLCTNLGATCLTMLTLWSSCRLIAWLRLSKKLLSPHTPLQSSPLVGSKAIHRKHGRRDNHELPNEEERGAKNKSRHSTLGTRFSSDGWVDLFRSMGRSLPLDGVSSARWRLFRSMASLFRSIAVSIPLDRRLYSARSPRLEII